MCIVEIIVLLERFLVARDSLSSFSAIFSSNMVNMSKSDIGGPFKLPSLLLLSARFIRNLAGVVDTGMALRLNVVSIF